MLYDETRSIVFESFRRRVVESLPPGFEDLVYDAWINHPLELRQALFQALVLPPGPFKFNPPVTFARLYKDYPLPDPHIRQRCEMRIGSFFFDAVGFLDETKGSMKCRDALERVKIEGTKVVDKLWDYVKENATDIPDVLKHFCLLTAHPYRGDKNTACYLEFNLDTLRWQASLVPMNLRCSERFLVLRCLNPEYEP